MCFLLHQWQVELNLQRICSHSCISLTAYFLEVNSITCTVSHYNNDKPLTPSVSVSATESNQTNCIFYNYTVSFDDNWNLKMRCILSQLLSVVMWMQFLQLFELIVPVSVQWYVLNYWFGKKRYGFNMYWTILEI